MSVTFQSTRFGTVEVAEEQIVEFRLGLVGLEGTRYALVDANPGTGFLWLHSLEDPALALPVVSPVYFFPEFELDIAREDRERTGLDDATGASVYVTVRATADPMEATANLRAPLLIVGTSGYQVINMHPAAELRAPLFELEAGQAAGADAA